MEKTPVVSVIPVADLIPYARNSRTHDEAQVAQLAASLEEFGMVGSVVVRDGVIAKGHGTLAAIRKLYAAGKRLYPAPGKAAGAEPYPEGTAPVLEVSGWTDAQFRAYVIADNKLALAAGWDEDMLRVEFEALKEDGFDLSLVGFDADELSDLFADAGEGEGEGGEDYEPEKVGSLAERFLIPPFSVLNAREGWWQERKRGWLALGIKSELGRGDSSGELGKGEMGGVLMKSWTSHPTFYPQKIAKEKELGRELTTAEFIEKHFVAPTDDAYSSGTSIFDPVVCELAYSWFSPVGGVVLDPFAGGSVRGVVAAKLGRKYFGHELRGEQVEANRAQWDVISGRAAAPDVGTTDDPDAITPVQRVGDVWIKRDDLFVFNGVPGGKVRTCLALSRGATGVVTAGSRSSPQVNIVSAVAQALGIPARCHTPQGELSPEVQAAKDRGAEIIQHKAGYNTVIVKRAKDDAAKLGWTEIPFGMECAEAIKQTRRQVANLPAEVTRIVMPCGSGMSLCGVLHGLDDIGRSDVRVVAVQVGADPLDRLKEYAPKDWKQRVELVPSGMDYHDPAPVTSYAGIRLDPHYEAKALPFLQSGDLFWIVGIRATALEKPVAQAQSNDPTPVWINGDSRNIDRTCAEVDADLVFTCPPYADLEVYSDNPADLSTLGYEEFRAAYFEIIKKACSRLKNDRFACCVVGEVRDKKGNYYDFVGDTVQAFRDAGLHYYNEAILVTAIGSLPIRAGKQFATSRKLGKTHQNILVFVKGDGKKAAAACGEVDVSAAISFVEGAGSEQA